MRVKIAREGAQPWNIEIGAITKARLHHVFCSPLPGFPRGDE